MNMLRRILALVLVILLAATPVCLGAEDFRDGILCEDGLALTETLEVYYGEYYTDPDEVALYLCAFVELPPNYITKSAARRLGWDSSAGNLWEVTDHMSIGGDRFGNREGVLPDRRGRQWYEADLNYEGGYRGAERLLFSSDGLICYSGDHYKSYTLLYEGFFDPESEYGGGTDR